MTHYHTINLGINRLFLCFWITRKLKYVLLASQQSVLLAQWSATLYVTDLNIERAMLQSHLEQDNHGAVGGLNGLPYHQPI